MSCHSINIFLLVKCIQILFQCNLYMQLHVRYLHEKSIYALEICVMKVFKQYLLYI